MSADLFKTNSLHNGNTSALGLDWDDTELIKAYNESIGEFRKEKQKGHEAISEQSEAAVPGPWLPTSDTEFNPAAMRLQKEVIVIKGESLTEEEEELNVQEGSPIAESEVDYESQGSAADNNKQKDVSPKRYDDEEDQERLYLLTWKVGLPCRAVYSEDGLEYEAKILQIDRNLEYCTVRYYGYDNKERVLLRSLKSSKGNRARDKQREEAKIYEAYQEQASSNVIHSTFDYESVSATTRVPSKSKRRKQSFGWEAELADRRFPVTNNVLRESSEEDEVNQQRQQQQPSPGTSANHDWLKSFPNLFVPPMPTCMGQHDFSKGSLQSIMMSWYNAGYHSGYYDAKQEFLQKGKERQKK